MGLPSRSIGGVGRRSNSDFGSAREFYPVPPQPSENRWRIWHDLWKNDGADIRPTRPRPIPRRRAILPSRWPSGRGGRVCLGGPLPFGRWEPVGPRGWATTAHSWNILSDLGFPEHRL